MASKPKTPQKENLTGVSERDQFQTPNYAVDLLIPFLAKLMTAKTVWECAAGLGKIERRLKWDGWDVIATDLAYEGVNRMNFLTDAPNFQFDVTVTNPPFSLKEKFYEKCKEYRKPFALLVPAEYTGWGISAVEKFGCEKIVPSRRVDYITPDILRRIWEGEAWKDWGVKTCTLKEWKESHTVQELQNMLDTGMQYKFDSIYDAPAELLKKYSSSQFHSMWLTWGFNIGRTETFVELSNEDKLNI